MTRADMANYVIARLRQRGVSFGQLPQNGATDLSPPYLVDLALNTAYNISLAKTVDYRLATIDVDFLTIAGATNFALNPLPDGAVLNAAAVSLYGKPLYGGAVYNSYLTAHRPAVLQVYEMRYCFGNIGNGTLAQERWIPSTTSKGFRRVTGSYTQRFGTLGPFPARVAQQYGLRRVDLFPGFATAGDTVKLFACPDPQGTEAAYPGGVIPCALGGQMTLDTDVPLLPSEFHMALVHHATAQLAGIYDKLDLEKTEYELWQSYLDDAEQYGATTMEGDTEQVVEDSWITAADALSGM